MSAQPESRQPVKVTIFNQTYTLVSQGDSAELVQVAREIDQLMHSIAEKTGSHDPARVAVLACLHLADRMRAFEAFRNQLNQRAEEFSILLGQIFESE